jgi:hypothetical protein
MSERRFDSRSRSCAARRGLGFGLGFQVQVPQLRGAAWISRMGGAQSEQNSRVQNLGSRKMENKMENKVTQEQLPRSGDVRLLCLSPARKLAAVPAPQGPKAPLLALSITSTEINRRPGSPWLPKAPVLAAGSGATRVLRLRQKRSQPRARQKVPKASVHTLPRGPVDEHH